MQQDSLRCHINIARLSVFGGVILAAFVSLTGQSDSLIAQPLIGLIVSLLLLGLSFSFQFNILLRLTLAFLVGTLVNQAMLNSFELTIGDISVALFWHLPILTLFFIGFYAVIGKNLKQATEMLRNYLIAGIVACLHMIILFILLSRTFGFGYENSLQIFVNLIVFSVFLSGLVVVLTDKIFFRGLSIILGIYFLAIILVN